EKAMRDRGSTEEGARMKSSITIAALLVSLYCTVGRAFGEPPSYPLVCHGGPEMRIVVNQMLTLPASQVPPRCSYTSDRHPKLALAPRQRLVNAPGWIAPCVLAGLQLSGLCRHTWSLLFR